MAVLAQAQVASLHSQSSVPVSLGNRLVPVGQPLWEASGDRSALRPSAFELGAGPSRLRVRLDTSDLASGPCSLVGVHDGAPVFSGRVHPQSADDGLQDVVVTLLAEPRRFRRIQGAVDWLLVPGAGGKPANVGRSEVELYWVPRESHRMFHRGIPVESLRELASAGAAPRPAVARAVGGPEGADDDLAAMYIDVPQTTNQVFNSVPPRYDVWQGASWFTSGSFSNLTLDLAGFLAARSQPTYLCNCYDHAAVLQYYLRLSGLTNVSFAYVAPFGYLATTFLVGRGPCNNPFYGSNPAVIVIGQTSSQRTWFANHAFCSLPGGTAADSCAGPHIGNETLASYLGNATDGVTPNPPMSGRATTANIVNYAGVTSVNAVAASAADDPLERARGEFEAAVGLAPRTVAAAPAAVACPWPDPRQAPVLAGGAWELSVADVLTSTNEAVRTWHLRDGEAGISVSIWVASDGSETARRRFVALGSRHSSSKPVFARGPAALGHCSGEFRAPGRTRFAWLFHNVVFDVHSVDADVDLEALALWLQQVAQAHVVSDLRGRLPVAAPVAPTHSVPVGGSFTLRVPAAAGLDLEARTDTGALRWIEEAPGALTFRAERAGDHAVTVIVTDPSTLLVSSASVTVRAFEPG